MFYALLGSTTVLLEDSVSKGDPNWILYSSGDYRGLTGRPNESSMLLLEGTTVLLEDSVSKIDPKLNLVLFWRLPRSYWKTK